MATTVTPIKSPETPHSVSAIEPRDPTPDQRMKIRNLLDKHFDDGKGIYLDDMSDHIVAEKVGVPRIIVERLREAAYGALKVDPVIAGLRAELAQVKRSVESQREILDKLFGAAVELDAKIKKYLGI